MTVCQCLWHGNRQIFTHDRVPPIVRLIELVIVLNDLGQFILLWELLFRLRRHGSQDGVFVYFSRLYIDDVLSLSLSCTHTHTHTHSLSV